MQGGIKIKACLKASKRLAPALHTAGISGLKIAILELRRSFLCVYQLQ